MDGRADIGGRVHQPSQLYKGCGDVLMPDFSRTQGKTVRKQQVKQQADCHCGKHDAAQIKIIFAVTHEKRDQRPRDQRKPCGIRKDEPFAEWNQVVKRAVDEILRCGDNLLKREKAGEISDKKENRKGNRVLYCKGANTMNHDYLVSALVLCMMQGLCCQRTAANLPENIA